MSDIRKILTLPLVESRTYGTDTYSACVTNGKRGLAYEDWDEGYEYVRNDESETELRAVTAGKHPFDNLAAGDLVRLLGEFFGNDRDRVVATATDADNLVLNREIDARVTAGDGQANGNYVQAEGYRWAFRKLSCSTDAGVAYFPVKGWQAGNILLIGEAEASGAGGLDYKVEAYVEGSGQDPQILASGNLSQAAIAAGGPSASVALGAFDFGTYGWTHIRLSVKVPSGTVTYSAYITLKE